MNTEFKNQCNAIPFPFVLEADVILDPNTANPDLLVSEDGKKIRAKEYRPRS